MKKIILVSLFVFIFFTSCGKAEVVSIAIREDIRTVYYEDIKISDIILVITYNDETTTQRVANKSYLAESHYALLSTPGYHEIEFVYSLKTCVFAFEQRKTDIERVFTPDERIILLIEGYGFKNDFYYTRITLYYSQITSYMFSFKAKNATIVARYQEATYLYEDDFHFFSYTSTYTGSGLIQICLLKQPIKSVINDQIQACFLKDGEYFLLADEDIEIIYR